MFKARSLNEVQGQDRVVELDWPGKKKNSIHNQKCYLCFVYKLTRK